jgi:hypothetical protein
MNILELSHFRLPSAVIRNLHIDRVTTLPDKTDPPLLIDADAVLPGPISLDQLPEALGLCLLVFSTSFRADGNGCGLSVM